MEESEKTRRARKYLEKQKKSRDKKLSSKELNKKTAEIHRWIERHVSQRVVLRNKSISLFDENRNTAEETPRISKVAGDLKKRLTKN